MGIFIDFSKAFDTIKHEILLSKLSHYGIRGIALDLICDYLTNRKQFVFYDNDCYSQLSDISIGVPQGSVLGPLFFIIYVNDIISCMDDSVKIYLSMIPIFLFQHQLQRSYIVRPIWFSLN